VKKISREWASGFWLRASGRAGKRDPGDDAVMAGPLFQADELPMPADGVREAPEVRRVTGEQTLI
jgi:hypothetical protein